MENVSVVNSDINIQAAEYAVTDNYVVHKLNEDSSKSNEDISKSNEDISKLNEDVSKSNEDVSKSDEVISKSNDEQSSINDSDELQTSSVNKNENITDDNFKNDLAVWAVQH